MIVFVGVRDGIKGILIARTCPLQILKVAYLGEGCFK